MPERPKCGGPAEYRVAWCEGCDPMQCCHAPLVGGSVILTAEQVDGLRGLLDAAEIALPARLAEGPETMAFYYSGRASALALVLTMIDGAE